MTHRLFQVKIEAGYEIQFYYKHVREVLFPLLIFLK